VMVIGVLGLVAGALCEAHYREGEAPAEPPRGERGPLVRRRPSSVFALEVFAEDRRARPQTVRLGGSLTYGCS